MGPLVSSLTSCSGQHTPCAQLPVSLRSSFPTALPTTAGEGEERRGRERGCSPHQNSVTAKSRPMMNLVSRYSARDPNVLASTASESPGKTKSESQKVPLSSLNVQQKCTGRPVLLASSSNYSEWNIEDKWSFQVWKSDDMLGTSTERPADDKLVIDDDMYTNTATESDLSLKSRSFLHRVNHRLRKILDHSSKDAMQDIDKRFFLFGECLCLQHWKHLYSWERITQTIYIPSKTTGKVSL